MSRLLDRRPNGRHKSAVNRQRFMNRYKKQIQEAVRQAVSGRSIKHVDETGEKITILTATSGDTGAAVAHAFYGLPNIEVVILYPNGKISPLQEKLFCTLGGNIRTIAIEGTFDDCQAMVKQAFDDE